MKRIFKKNQIIITVLAVMIAVAGYLNYSGRLLEKEAEQITSGEDTVLLTASDEDSVTADTGTYTDIVSLDGDGSEEAAASDVIEENAGTDDTPGTAVLASTTAGDSLIAQAKLNREQIRAKNKETLLEVINNDNVAEEQKQAAAANMTSITELAEREAAAELLLEAKGYTDSVVSITDGTVDVVVNMAELDEAQRAQIEDIVKRKTDISGENIIITPRSAEE